MKSAPNMSNFFFSRILASLLEGQMIFAQHVSGKKVTPQRVLKTCSFFLKALINVYFQDVQNPQPRNLSYPHCIWHSVSCSDSELKMNLQLNQNQFLFYLRKEEKLQHTCECIHM